jgi:hypothetical protein
MSGTQGSYSMPREGGLVELPAASFDLQPAASDTWTDTGLQIALPGPGTYRLDATVRGELVIVSASSVFMKARLWDVTSGVLVPRSEVFVTQVSQVAGTAEQIGHDSAPIQVEYTVTGPATVRVEAARVDLIGTTQAAVIFNDQNGRTTLRWERAA